jgi:hypothetical protein
MRRGHALPGLAAIALAACASAPPAGSMAPKVVKGFALAPYGTHEECVVLGKGDRLDYRFTGTAPVGFNIQFRDGNAVLMPISRAAVTADSGIYQPVESHEFCLAWEAGAAPVTLDYQVSVKRGGP